jgi:hypothetical protein
MCARTSVWRAVLIASILVVTTRTAMTAERPLVRFAACGTCTAQGVESLIIKQTNIPELGVSSVELSPFRHGR